MPRLGDIGPASNSPPDPPTSVRVTNMQRIINTISCIMIIITIVDVGELARRGEPSKVDNFSATGSAARGALGFLRVSARNHLRTTKTQPLEHIMVFLRTTMHTESISSGR